MGLAWGVTMTMNGVVKDFGGAMAGRFILGGTSICHVSLPARVWMLNLDARRLTFDTSHMALSGQEHPREIREERELK